MMRVRVRVRVGIRAKVRVRVRVRVRVSRRIRGRGRGRVWIRVRVRVRVKVGSGSGSGFLHIGLHIGTVPFLTFFFFSHSLSPLHRCLGALDVTSPPLPQSFLLYSGVSGGSSDFPCVLIEVQRSTLD